MDKLTLINAETAKRGLSLYLIIDEYDNKFLAQYQEEKYVNLAELKILSKKEWNEKVKDDELGEVTKAEKQWHDAVKQIKGYAQAPRVEALRQGTTLHKIIMQFEGWELKRMDEV